MRKNTLATKLLWSTDHYKEQGDKAWEKAQKEGEQFLGNPLGKKPVALFQALLFRMAELAEAEGVAEEVLKKYVAKSVAAGAEEGEEKAKERVQRVMLQLVATGKAASKKPVRTTRCFMVSYVEVAEEEDDEVEMVKWVAATPDPAVNSLLEEIRDMNLFEPVGVTLVHDFGPRTKEAKAIAKLAFGKGKGRGRGRGLFSKT